VFDAARRPKELATGLEVGRRELEDHQETSFLAQYEKSRRDSLASAGEFYCVCSAPLPFFEILDTIEEGRGHKQTREDEGGQCDVYVSDRGSDT